MRQSATDRLTDAELNAFLDELFPHGVAGPDVIAEIAPEGWEESALVECLHPPGGRGLEGRPVEPHEEPAELVGRCLWDVFSDNHEVLDADGRRVDLGSFRGASAFLDDDISGRGGAWLHDDYLRFYMGTFAIAGRADVAEANQRGRDEAMDRQPPAPVRAYRQVYGRDPRGWPPE